MLVRKSQERVLRYLRRILDCYNNISYFSLKSLANFSISLFLKIIILNNTLSF